MNLSDSHVYRAIRGGVWERTDAIGWYRMSDEEYTACQCRVPPGVTHREDLRDGQPLVLAMAAVIVSVLLIALWAWGMQ